MAKPYLQSILQNKLNEMNLSATEFERRAGLPRASIYKIINGASNNPTLDTLSAIAKALNCGIDDLVGQRVRDKSATPDFTEVIHSLPWINDLFSKITNATCKYLKEADKNPTFEQIIKAIVDIYNYCIEAKNSNFDESFHKWFMQKFLDELDA